MEALQTAAQLSDIGRMLAKLGDYEGALEQYELCLLIQEEELGLDEPQPETATTCMRIGLLLTTLKQYDSACMVLQRSYNIRKALYGRKNPLTQECLDAIELVMEVAISEREESFEQEKGYHRTSFSARRRSTVTSKPNRVARG